MHKLRAAARASRPVKRDVVVIDEVESANEQPVVKIVKRDEAPAPSHEIVELQHKLVELEDNLQRSRNDTREAEVRAEHVEKLLESKQVENQAMNEKVVELQKKLDDALERLDGSERSEENAYLAKLRAERAEKLLESKQVENEAMDEKVDELQKMLDDAVERLDGSERSEENAYLAEVRAERAEKLLESKQVENEEMNEKVGELQNKLDDALDRVEGSAKKEEKASCENRELAREKEVLNNEVAELQKKLDDALERLEGSERSEERACCNNRELAREKEVLNKEVADMKKTVSEVMESNGAIQNTLAAVSYQFGETRRAADDLAHVNEALMIEMANMKEQEQMRLNQLMTERQKTHEDRMREIARMNEMSSQKEEARRRADITTTVNAAISRANESLKTELAEAKKAHREKMLSLMMERDADKHRVRECQTRIDELTSKLAQYDERLQSSLAQPIQLHESSFEVVKLQQKLLKSEENLQLAHRATKEAELRAEHAENLLDSKQGAEYDDDKDKVEELENKLAEVSSQLDEERKQADIKKTEFARENAGLKTELAELRKSMGKKQGGSLFKDMQERIFELEKKIAMDDAIADERRRAIHQRVEEERRRASEDLADYRERIRQLEKKRDHDDRVEEERRRTNKDRLEEEKRGSSEDRARYREKILELEQKLAGKDVLLGKELQRSSEYRTKIEEMIRKLHQYEEVLQSQLAQQQLQQPLMPPRPPSSSTYTAVVARPMQQAPATAAATPSAMKTPKEIKKEEIDD